VKQISTTLDEYVYTADDTALRAVWTRFTTERGYRSDLWGKICAARLAHFGYATAGHFDPTGGRSIEDKCKRISLCTATNLRKAYALLHL
jgi:hypothetical protein